MPFHSDIEVLQFLLGANFSYGNNGSLSFTCGVFPWDHREIASTGIGCQTFNSAHLIDYLALTKIPEQIGKFKDLSFQARLCDCSGPFDATIDSFTTLA